ncbi:MAG: DUF1559 domain-containing protein [Abditibacteriales bacterium]|nr:DUF1559 domain-containing protein [Abditibacteriales bacterium]
MPVFAQAREKARMASCMSNMKQIALAAGMYIQDYDGTYFYNRFVDFTLVWRNVIQPYVKNKQVFACPSNPRSGDCPPNPRRTSAGNCAEGWDWETDRSMPISYGHNTCTTSWIPAN